MIGGVVNKYVAYWLIIEANILLHIKSRDKVIRLYGMVHERW
jgi:hypothetical protein